MLLLLAGAVLAADHAIDVRLLNGQELAAQRYGTTAISLAGLFTDVDAKARDVLAEQLRLGLAEDGVEAMVTLERQAVAEGEWQTFDATSGQVVPLRVPAGAYDLIVIRVLNTDTLVEREKGALTRKVGRVLGLDLEARVNAHIVDVLFAELTAGGARAAIRLR